MCVERKVKPIVEVDEKGSFVWNSLHVARSCKVYNAALR